MAGIRSSGTIMTSLVLSQSGEMIKEYREKSAKAFAILLHLMRGTPYIYQGEEIGMTNYPFETLDQVEDIESLNYARGGSLKRRSDWKKSMDQYSCHWTVTMLVLQLQWDENKTLVSQQVNLGWQLIQTTKQSTFKKHWQIQILFSIPIRSWFRSVRRNSWLIRADFELLDTADKIFAYIRKDGDRRFLVVANLSNEKQNFLVEGRVKSILIENTTAKKAVENKPWLHGMLSVWN